MLFTASIPASRNGRKSQVSLPTGTRNLLVWTRWVCQWWEAPLKWERLAYLASYSGFLASAPVALFFVMFYMFILFFYLLVHEFIYSSLFFFLSVCLEKVSCSSLYSLWRGQVLSMNRTQPAPPKWWDCKWVAPRLVKCLFLKQPTNQFREIR